MKEYIVRENIADAIEKSIYADRIQELIRCKDCKWHLFYYDAKYRVGYSLCGNPKNMLNDSMIDVSADGYCSSAERREEE